jgi:hypothetical protein
MNSDREGMQPPPEEMGKSDNDVSPVAHLSQLQHEIADLAQFRALMDCCDDAIFIFDTVSDRIIAAVHDGTELRQVRDLVL